MDGDGCCPDGRLGQAFGEGPEALETEKIKDIKSLIDLKILRIV
jgi:hypothetical protein